MAKQGKRGYGKVFFMVGFVGVLLAGLIISFNFIFGGSGQVFVFEPSALHIYYYDRGRVSLDQSFELDDVVGLRMPRDHIVAIDVREGEGRPASHEIYVAPRYHVGEKRGQYDIVAENLRDAVDLWLNEDKRFQRENFSGWNKLQPDNRGNLSIGSKFTVQVRSGTVALHRVELR